MNSQWKHRKRGQELLVLSGKENVHIQPITKEDNITLNRLASVGQIAAGIAHEVKNPLTAVKGFLQLLQAEMSHTYLDLACSELENALSTLQNLLHVAKPDLEEEPFVPIQLCTELESILFLFQEQSYHIEVETSFLNSEEKVYGKRNQLKKAFFNLLKNAFEAIPEKGRILVKHYKSGNSIIVRISDTGVGIPENKLSMLGTPFFTSKTTGTGMGLTQVYSTIYDHGGTIKVSSEEGKGTTFYIQFPTQSFEKVGVVHLDLQYTEGQGFSDFFLENKAEFNELLTSQGREFIDNIISSSGMDEEFLIESAHKIVRLLNEINEQGLVLHAKEQGKGWAKFNLELLLILEWFHVIRKIYWDFLFNYHHHINSTAKEVFELERAVNYSLDTYLKHFSASFAAYTKELLKSQRNIIEDLSVPIIPLNESVAILPIVGALDIQRARKIQETVLMRIYELKVKHLILDLSGVAFMDTGVVQQFCRILNGIDIQGCKAIITGIRPEITNKMVEIGTDLHKKVETKGTLQQAIEEFELI
jgi:anti-anti-sigma factor